MSGGGGATGGGAGGGSPLPDSGCYPLALGTFVRGQFAGQLRALVVGGGPTSVVQFNVNPTYARNYESDGGSAVLDGGVYDLSLMIPLPLPSRVPFALSAGISAGPLGGPPGGLGLFYVATAGSVALNAVTTPPSFELAGSLSQVRFTETSAPPFGGDWKAVDGGLCAIVEYAPFDTRVALGTPCTRATDCGDTRLKSCNPQTGTCQPVPCSATPNAYALNGNQVCVAQTSVGTPRAYANYPRCQPSASACGAGKTCVALTEEVDTGYCANVGTNAEGASCQNSATDLSTGCVVGLSCANVLGSFTETCVRMCDLYVASPGCTGGKRCSARSRCEVIPLMLADAAQVGEACGAGAEAKLCADDGAAYRGACSLDSLGGSTSTCRKLCRTVQSCAAGQSCVAVSGSALRECR